MLLVLKLKMIYRLDLELKCGRDFEVEVQSIFWMLGLDEMYNLEFGLNFKVKLGKIKSWVLVGLLKFKPLSTSDF